MIPKIIHHVWPGDDPFKQKFHNFRNTWMKYHPDWTFYFWRLDNLPKNLKKEVLEIVNSEEYSVIVKSDILRYELLRIYGGLYVDTDMECFCDFEQFCNFQFYTGLAIDAHYGEYACPSVIASTPNNEVITDIVQSACSNIKQYDVSYVNKSPNLVTGPILFTECLNKYRTDPSVHLFEPKFLFEEPYAYARHHWSGCHEDGWTRTDYIRLNKISLLYKNILKRPADEHGLLQYYHSGISLEQIEHDILSSAEYKGLNNG